MSDPAALRDAKQGLRRRMRQLRTRVRDDATLIACILDTVAFRPGETIAGVWPLPGEPDLRPLWHRLHASGHAILLPETPPPGEPLRFRVWHPGCAMLPGRSGTRHPQSAPGACTPDPTLLFVPLLAFDSAGHRLGYGGGYYDRTLAALPRARSIGYGFSFQQVEAVPRGPFDLPLCMIVTEAGRVQIER